MTIAESPVRPFGILRLAHDAMRAGIAEVQEAAALLGINGNSGRLIGEHLAALRDCMQVHRAQEDRCLFPVINYVSGGRIDAEGIPTEHEDEVAGLRALIDSLDGTLDRPVDPQAVADALAAWIRTVEQHFAHEEQVMLPWTDKLASTLEGRAAIAHQLIEVDGHGFLTKQIGYVSDKLSHAGALDKLIAYVRALQFVARATEFPVYASIIRNRITGDHRHQLAGVGLL